VTEKIEEPNRCPIEVEIKVLGKGAKN